VKYFYIFLASRLNKGIAEDGKKNLKKNRDFILSCGIFFVSLQQRFSGRRESQRCPRCIHEKHQIKNLKILRKMENHIMRDDVTPNVMQHIQRLASTLNNDPMYISAVDFDVLRAFTNGFKPNLVVLLLVSITKDDVREYLRDNIFDALRMDNELMTEEMRESEIRLENRLKEMWRQVTVRLRYEKQSKARRNDALARMLGISPNPSPVRMGENIAPNASPVERGMEKMPSLKIIINNNQSGDDKRRIEMTGDKQSYNEN
jgi:hypothetical protein